MTLSDLGVHFGVGVAEITRENPHLAGTRLEAGEEYVIPVRGLTLERHRVHRGETLGELTARYDLPTLYTIRTLNCLPSVRIEAGDELLVYRRGVMPSGRSGDGRPAERQGFSSPPDSRWRHAGVYDYDPSSGLLKLQVFQGMTLSDLAIHFRLSPDDIAALNPSLHGDRVLAGQHYWIPTDHLKASRYRVGRGDTIETLSRTLRAPTPYSIRTWNGLPSNTLRRGQELIVFVEGDSSD